MYVGTIIEYLDFGAKLIRVYSNVTLHTYDETETVGNQHFSRIVFN